MKTFADIYTEMCDKRGQRFSLRELLNIFEKEDGSWVGERQQLLELRSLQHEVTGIRPGECSNCNVEVMRNMIKWVNKYEIDNPAPQLRTMEEVAVAPPKQKRRRGLQ